MPNNRHESVPAPSDEQEPVAWYRETVAETLERTGTQPERGLDEAEAAARLVADGPNELPPPARPSHLRMFLSQFNDLMVWLLVVAAFIAASGRDYLDAFVILGILVLNAVLGFVQESKAEQAIDALREMSAPRATVIRDGHKETLPAGELVVGDIVVLAAGDIVPADLRLTEVAELQVDEASLTGESHAVFKSTDVIEDENLVLGDRVNMVSLGSTVQLGRGLGVVVATGESTELGRIAMVASGQETITPLQRELKRVGRVIAIFVVIASSLVFLAGALTGRPLDEMFLAAVSLAVSAIPEALTAVVTITLAVGVKRMAEKRAIVRKMHSVETMGSIDVIATDKTGTLTLNEMTVVALEGADGSSLGVVDIDADAPEWAKRLLHASAMVNDAEVTSKRSIGDPTETALLAAAQRTGLDKPAADTQAPRRGEIAFTSERKMMTTLHQEPDGWATYTKGAPERVLRRCVLDEGQLAAVEATVVRMAAAGLRTLAVAERRFDTRPEHLGLAEEKLELLGVVGLVDPPRPEVAEAIRIARGAGVRVIMVTGDHEVTARAIASQVGLPEGGQVLVGRDIERMDDAELAEALDDATVIARVDPLHKMRIVKALQAKQHVVAVTGDGVNDAPALSAADVGVAMGVTGTDVAKDASDMVLADDNFATIVAAIHEGRVVFTNLSKFVQFLLSANTSQVLLMFLATLGGLPVPLFPVQLLFTNMATDSLPALALGVDPGEKGLMARSPRGPGEGIITRESVTRILSRGVMLMTGTLGAYLGVLILHGVPLSHVAFEPQYARAVMTAQTAAFTALVLQKLLFSLTFRSQTRSIFSRATLANRLLLGAIAVGAVMQVAVVYLPGAGAIFRTVPLGLPEWTIMAPAILIPVIVIDAVKVFSARSMRVRASSTPPPRHS